MRRDFRIRRGTTLSYPGVARQEDGTILDLTSAAISWRVGRFNRRVTEFTKTVGSGITITDATAGEYTLQADPADTSELEPEIYSHEAEATVSGVVTTILNGCLDLQRDLP